MNIKPIALEGAHITLLPMNECHIDELTAAANDERIWGYMEPLMDRKAVERFVKQTVKEQQEGLCLPFSVYDKSSDKLVGSTRLFDISTAHRNGEIGFTWYNPSVWRTYVNTECKFLLLRYCFESLGMIRVQLKADLRNQRSLTAIARLGAQREGVLRQHRVLHDGYIRDTVMFSIIDQEWPQVKSRLEEIMYKKDRVTP
ncbi:GNAT family N-acetyltransferase [Paenibacillus aestuarii]|uniref:GNAT family protein n=1 Tax=Paenibacillus aestuarii TaxID=516965 RepID=A0ABW0K3G2_9BACL|nr:GNAT family protein [Paenibacillus aestuarii]